MLHSALHPDTFFDKDLYTEAEYFHLEDASQSRWEFLPEGLPRPKGRRLGRICAMTGGTVDHGGIAMNLGVALNNAFRAAGIQTCRVFGSDVKIHSAEGRNTYPDVSALCGKPSYYGGRRDIITNPILIGEVLSPSTEAYDRSEKWTGYQTIATLQHYLLLSADRMRVELYTREDQGWHFVSFEGEDAHMPLSKLGVTLALSDLYAHVEFDSE